MTRRLLAILLGLAPLATAVSAQAARPSPADSQLVLRILTAEDRRDASDPALAEGARSDDPRIRVLAGRARGRIADPTFAGRTALPPLPAPPAWEEPDWKARHRALGARTPPCPPLVAALDDPSWPVRLRAMDLLHAGCAGDPSVAPRLLEWVRAIPAPGTPRPTGGVSWHAGAHALVALARVDAPGAAGELDARSRHGNPHVRRYAALAAAAIRDTAVLQRLAADPNPNVREVALQVLAVVMGHEADAVFLRALGDTAPQVVRVAAEALEGTADSSAALRAREVLDRWTRRHVDPERDARVALRRLAGISPTEGQAPQPPVPAEAAALALGAERRIRVTMAPASGGGSFVVRLRGDVAPITAARILALADSAYYDGTTWHRVEPDFVIQGGSPGENEYVGYPRFFRDELGTVPHARGTVGMSTRGHDTGDAQWFVNLRDNLRLGSDYTVFAEVIEGMDVVDGMMEGDVIAAVRRGG